VIGLQQLRSRAQVEVQTALERYERARSLAGQQRSDFSRTIPDELQKIQEQFEAGQADILNVYAAQTSLLQEHRAYLDLLNELAQAAADVTLAAGMPPARLVSTTSFESP
jgi:outer membrane protein TolC